MNRRSFLYTGLGSGFAAVTLPGLVLLPGCKPEPDRATGGADALDLDARAAELRHLLFDDYLPFWENGGYDEELGGFMCYLYDDGSVQDDRKDIWYQGRAIWVYSFLYNNLDRDPKWLDMATRTRDFMVRHMYVRGEPNGRSGGGGDSGGVWIDTVDRSGRPVAGLDASRDGNIYGAVFAAVGLIQLAKATGREQDVELARQTIRDAIARYDDPEYRGVVAPETSERGLRAQGHSFMVVWVVQQLLELGPDPFFESLLRGHIDLLATRFWNPEYGISNEILRHDYSRIAGLDVHMVPGHSIEAQWMAMDACSGLDDTGQAELFRTRMRRLIEMSWDYVFDGIGDTDFRVFGDAGSGHVGADFSIKTMWAQTEVLVGTLRSYATTRSPWALDWYGRAWDYVRRTMTTGYGVWRQAVDRSGRGVDRPGIPVHRKGNFHQPRCLMLNLLEIERLKRDHSQQA